MRLAIDLRPLLEPFESGVTVYIKEMVKEIMKFPAIDLDLFYHSRNPSENIQSIFPNARHIELSNLFFHIHSLFKFQKLPETYFTKKPDLIWIPDRRPFFITDIPVVMTIHDFVPELLPRTLSLKSRIWHKIFSYKRLANLSSAFLVPSITTGSKIKNKKYEITYEGAVVPQNVHMPSDYKKIAAKKFFLCVSPLDPRKRLNWIFVVAKKFPNVNFVIAGIKKNDSRFTKSNVNKSSNIILLGQITNQEKFWLYKNAEALIAISVYEGFDLPVLEAVKVKCPVIMSDINVHRELYKSDFFVKNQDDLLIGIKRILMGYKNIPKERGHYTWNLAAKRALFFFGRVVADKNRNRSGYRNGDNHSQNPQ